MPNLQLLFRNRFSRRLPDDSLRRYAAEHVRRLEVSTRPYAAPLAVRTREAVDGYFSVVREDDVRAALSKGTTAAKEEAKEAVFTSLSRYEGSIRGRWGRGTPEYLRFFPRGLSDFRQASQDSLADKITTFERALEELGDDLPAEVVDAFLAPIDPKDPASGGTITRFRHARQRQLSAFGSTDGRREEAAAKRRALEWRLTVNLHAVAIEIAAAPEEERLTAMRLFPLHLLPASRRGIAPEAASGRATVPTAGAASAPEPRSTSDSGHGNGNTAPASLPLPG